MRDDSPLPDQPPLAERLVDAIDRIAAARRCERTDRAAEHGLSLLQADLLQWIETRRAEHPRLSDLARWLDLAPSTVSEALDALERKGLIERRPDPTDGRAVLVRTSGQGARIAASLAAPAALAAVLEAVLEIRERETLLGSLLGVIRRLQEERRIPVARMCVTCRWFEPFRHEGHPRRPHHCALVDAAIGDADLRVECAEWEPAPDERAARRWLSLRTTGGTR